MTRIPDWVDHVGPGWHPLLAQLHTDVVALDPEYVVVQVKEKFGGLRAYLNYQNPEITAIVRAAEVLSASICEDCGEPGFIRQRPKRTRMLCLCDVCVQKAPEPWLTDGKGEERTDAE